jgi:hypothetical protein
MVGWWHMLNYLFPNAERMGDKILYIAELSFGTAVKVVINEYLIFFIP